MKITSTVQDLSDLRCQVRIAQGRFMNAIATASGVDDAARAYSHALGEYRVALFAEGAGLTPHGPLAV